MAYCWVMGMMEYLIMMAEYSLVEVMEYSLIHMATPPPPSASFMSQSTPQTDQDVATPSLINFN